MRTTISIDDHLLDMAKRRALERRTTVGAVIEDALRAALLGGSSRASAPFTLVTFRGDGVQEGVNLDQPSGLLAAEDVERYGHR